MNKRHFSVFNETQLFLSQQGFKFEAHVTLSSTNDYAKSHSTLKHFDPYIILADKQTHGRGRGTNSWLSTEPGTQMLLTVMYDLPAAPQPITPPMVGLALFQSLRIFNYVSPLSIKAPNDIYLKDKKVAGILIETISQGPQHRIVIGIGLNVLSAPHDITTAGFIASEAHISQINWQKFLEQLFNELHFVAKACSENQLTSAAQDALAMALNARPNIEDKIIRVSPSGDLVYTHKTIPWRNL